MAVSACVKLGTAICEAVGLDSKRVGLMNLVLDAREYRASLTVTLFLSPEQEEVIIRRFKQADWKEEDGRRWESKDFYVPDSQLEERYKELVAEGWTIQHMDATGLGFMRFECQRLEAPAPA